MVVFHRHTTRRLHFRISHLLIAPGNWFDVTLATLNRQSVMTLYNCEMTDWMSITFTAEITLTDKIYDFLNAFRKKCLNTEFFLVCIFPHADQKKLRIWILFTQCFFLGSQNKYGTIFTWFLDKFWLNKTKLRKGVSRLTAFNLLGTQRRQQIRNLICKNI